MDCSCTFPDTQFNRWYSLETVLGDCLKKSVTYLSDMGTAEKLLEGLGDNSDLQGLSWKDQFRAIAYPAVAQEVYGGHLRGRLGGRDLTAIFEPVYPLGLPVSGTLKFVVYPHQSDIGEEVVKVWNGKKIDRFRIHEADFVLALRVHSGRYYLSRDVVEDWSRITPGEPGNISMEFHRFFEFSSSQAGEAAALLQPCNGKDPEFIGSNDRLYVFGMPVNWLSVPLNYDKLRALDVALISRDVPQQEFRQLFA